ncbi:MAG: hypothetical protein IAG13_05190 [Deltaproteobacteria bacterium]|nr:hypothetical protein [Nannocystaceae bacterium]
MKTYQLALVLPLLFPLGCSTDPAAGSGETNDDGASASPESSSAGPSTTVQPETTGEPATTDSGASSGPTPETSAASSDEGPKWDVGGAVDVGECEDAEAGIYCKDGVAVECDGVGNLVASETCLPNICQQGVGCVQCLEGQYHCSGPRVMACNADADPPRWVEIDVCNPQAGEGCDQGLGSCEVLQIVGTNVPTGDYYQYADFPVGSGFNGGYDVDTFENFLYVSSSGFGSGVDVYEVTLEDSDGDGELEPNQHPDNPDESGPIEERTIAFVETIPGVTVSQSTSEIYALEDRIYVGGYSSLTEYVFGVPGGTLFSSPPGWAGGFSMIGFDDINGVWYAANEGDRRVFQHDAETNAWGLAFYFPNLSGDHMDGVEVVTDPNTGTPYVYVSDMTSDFIGQYRLDPELGWVQENLFQYAGTAGALLEGMGFGAFNHFWATSGSSVYEVGGGDLATYTEPVPTG